MPSVHRRLHWSRPQRGSVSAGRTRLTPWTNCGSTDRKKTMNPLSLTGITAGLQGQLRAQRGLFDIARGHDHRPARPQRRRQNDIAAHCLGLEESPSWRCAVVRSQCLGCAARRAQAHRLRGAGGVQLRLDDSFAVSKGRRRLLRLLGFGPSPENVRTVALERPPHRQALARPEAMRRHLAGNRPPP